MLTKDASNALLKTLEEPPAHVVFILATTEPHRLPPTILSRCQRFDLRRIPVTLIVQHLTQIAQQEKVKIDAAALYAIVMAGNGRFETACIAIFAAAVLALAVVGGSAFMRSSALGSFARFAGLALGGGKAVIIGDPAVAPGGAITAAAAFSRFTSHLCFP